ncbi:MAG: type II toxin-antitoxin system RelB/DinJ family antitoxin [Clostridiales bacterium]|jgi:DNA-damage-inducible protein J|nr:type II toxin-antitoxin system RelB/DinJ family antitoxin [Clostridiales bacterium]
MAQMSIRIDDELRKNAEEILGELGLTMSAAVNIFARQVVRSRGLPFPLTLNDGHTQSRQDAAKSFVELAKSHPIKLPEGYEFNRDECYDE